MNIYKLFKKIKKQNGQAVVEIAIMMPFLLLIIVSIIELGIFFSDYMQLNNAVQYAGDIGKVHGTSNTTIIQALKNQCAGLNINNLAITIIPNDENNRPNGGWIFIKARYDYRFITPIISSILGNPYPMTAYTTRRIE